MKTSLHILPNKLRTLLIDTKAFPSATCLLLVNAGSRYENKKNNGIAHFFEHMAFKGSKKYPSTAALASLVEGFGGEFNAFTSKDYTGYYIKAPVQHTETMVDVLSDMITQPLLDKDEIEREKGVIGQEISMYEDTPQRIINQLYEYLLYKESPLGMDIIGTVATVNAATRKTFKDYMDTYYYANNAVLVVSGGLTGIKDEIKEKDHLGYATKYFSNWGQKAVPSFTPVKENQKKPATLLRYKKSEQAHLCFGYRTFGKKDERKYALSVLAAILGVGMSSRLFMEVRERRGLCYAVGTYTDHFNDVGTMVTYAGVPTDIKKVQEAIKVIKYEHESLAEGNIIDSELARAKEILKGRLILSLEDTFNVGYIYGKQLLHEGEIKPVEEIIKRIEEVSASDVINLARDIIKPSQANLALIGPFKSPSSFEKIIA